MLIYRVSQEASSIFCEVTVSVIISKKCISTCVLFQTSAEMELFHCTVVWIWRPILSVPPAALRLCLKHVNRCKASVGRCD